MALTKDLQDYYEARFDMMASKGWKDLIEDVKAMETSTNDISCVSDEKTLHFRKGELNNMRWLLGLEQSSRDTFEELKDAPIA